LSSVSKSPKTKHYIDRKDKRGFFHALWLYVCRGLKSFETADTTDIEIPMMIRARI